MADVTISALTLKATPVGTDELEVQETGGGTSKKTVVSALFDTDNHVDGTTNHVFTAADDTKLAGIEALADVTANAGALMDSEVDADLKTFSLPASTTISAFGATIVDDANAAAVIATLGLDADLTTFAVPASTTISAFGGTLVDDTDAVTARGTLGLDTPLNTQTGTTYAVVLTDAGKMITMNNASANTATLPANASIAFPTGSEVSFMQLGAGATTIAITTDTLSVESSLTLVLAGQYAVATAKKVTSTQWVLFGNLTAS